MRRPPGGVLHSEWIDEEIGDDARGKYKKKCFGMVWGLVTEDCATRYNNTRKGKTALVQFRVRLERGSYIRCTVYSGDPYFWAARRMKKGDRVVSVGRMVTYNYFNAEGKQMVAVDFYPFWLQSQQDQDGPALPEEGLDADAFTGLPPDADPDGEPWNPFDLNF